MGIRKDYWQRRLSLTGPKSVAILNGIERFFQGGRNWTQGEYHRENGQKCVIGAVETVQQGEINDARYWIRQAIRQLHPGWWGILPIESFNDTHTFAEVAEVIERAKQLALASIRQQSSTVEVLPPPQRPALTHQPEREGPTITVTLHEHTQMPVNRHN